MDGFLVTFLLYNINKLENIQNFYLLNQKIDNFSMVFIFLKLSITLKIMDGFLVTFLIKIGNNNIIIE